MPSTTLAFSKMHGAGNDFVVADDRGGCWPEDAAFIRRLCDRRRGIGADGLILLRPAPAGVAADLAMAFFNCDGSRADMCGNGLRCAALFARAHLAIPCDMRMATDVGVLAAGVLPDRGGVRIEIPVISAPRPVAVAGNSGWLVNTGVPHLVIPHDGCLDALDLAAVAPPLRHHPHFAPDGCNVDFVVLPEAGAVAPVIPIRTFERGVEGETLACGTGIAAAALALATCAGCHSPMTFQTVAGELLDVAIPAAAMSGHVLLTGPAVEVYAGTLVRG